MKNIKILAVLLMGIILFHSCKKYEEGPAFSLTSKKERLSGLWQCNEMYTLSTKTSCNGFQYGFYKDGNGIYYNNGWDFHFKWSFSEDKERIILNFDNNLSQEWNILRLTKEELFVYTTTKEADSTEITKEIHFIKIEE